MPRWVAAVRSGVAGLVAAEGLPANGKVVLTRQLRRGQVTAFLAAETYV